MTMGLQTPKLYDLQPDLHRPEQLTRFIGFAGKVTKDVQTLHPFKRLQAVQAGEVRVELWNGETLDLYFTAGESKWIFCGKKVLSEGTSSEVVDLYWGGGL